MLRQNYRRNCLLVVFLLMLTIAALGCPGVTPGPGQQGSSLKTQAYQTLMTDKQIYDSTFKTLALLDSQGKLPAAVKTKAIKLGNLYLVAHNLAVQSLLDNKEINLATVRTALDAFLDAVMAYTAGVT